MASTTFSIIVTVEDQLLSQRLVGLLTAEKIDAFSRARGAASADVLGISVPQSFEIFVPTEHLEKAGPLVKAELEALERDGAANAAAAEEEYMSGENPVPTDAK